MGYHGQRNISLSCLVIATVLIVVLVVKQEQGIQTSISPAKIRAKTTPPSTVALSELKFNINSKRKSIGGFRNVTTLRNRQPQPRTHIAFLKVHKAASSTVQNILYRFGLRHNLSFVLPQQGHYISKDADSYAEILPSLDKSGKYDILCNHAVFNEKKFKSLMHDDAFYLAIVRDPLERFVSAANYYRFTLGSHKYLNDMNQTTFLHDLITNPLKYEPKSLKDSKTFNQLAFDFGLGVSSIRQLLSLNEITNEMFVSKILERFDFVMLVEKFDESLVILKRHLNWTIKDIIYIKKNQFQESAKNTGIVIPKVTAKDEAIFKLTNHLDYLIYDKFVERFNKMAAKEKDLESEVKEFKTKLQLVQSFCASEATHIDAIFSETKFNAAFRVSQYDCQLMMKTELDFNDELRTSHNHKLYKLEHTKNNQ